MTQVTARSFFRLLVFQLGTSIEFKRRSWAHVERTSSLNTSLSFHPKSLKWKEGGRMYIWAMASDNRPHTCRESEKGENRYYIRRATETRKASPDEERRLLHMHAKIPFDDRRAFDSGSLKWWLFLPHAFYIKKKRLRNYPLTSLKSFNWRNLRRIQYICNIGGRADIGGFRVHIKFLPTDDLRTTQEAPWNRNA